MIYLPWNMPGQPVWKEMRVNNKKYKWNTKNCTISQVTQSKTLTTNIKFILADSIVSFYDNVVQQHHGTHDSHPLHTEQ
jgi:hypothetical protein